jgi:hypothetical protein
MTEPHPLRCETCKNDNCDTSIEALKHHLEETHNMAIAHIIENDQQFISRKGCASHSSASVSAEQVLDQIERTISDRIVELKSWINLAKINQDRKRELEILPILGENQAIWAQIQELWSQSEREQK